MNGIVKSKTELATTETVGTQMAMVTDAEVISSVLAAQAKAETEARYVVAMNRPRDTEAVRVKLVKECERPGFAESAYYQVKNRGEGLSIRFAEAAMRAMGNVDLRSTVVYDDDDKRVIKIDVVDLESNSSTTDTKVIMKRIERKYLKGDEKAIRTRINSYKETVYLRRATDDEIAPVQAAIVSKAFRNGVLRLLPGDIQDECKARILQLRNDSSAIPADPMARKRRIIDSFDSIGITIGKLREYLGHEIDACSPSEFEELHNLYVNIKSGGLKFHDVLDEIKAGRDNTPKKQSTLEELQEKHGAKDDADAATE